MIIRTHCDTSANPLQFVKYTFLGLVGVCISFITGCVCNKVESPLGEAIIGQTIAPPLELGFTAHAFRRETKRWPRNYEELSPFLKKSGDGVQIRNYDRVDFTERADGSLEIYAVAPGLTNRMTLTENDGDQK